ncbi:MAG TPA: selenium-dependent molybdenum cofactor biosynthesis protein YqeB [Chloroflexota bacterium]|nr:selenium-dependent molybdenum cofactor biosynthesis protein YqeB [Chloroflexota bacterium]
MPLAVVRGGGDIGTACAARLSRSGLRVVVAEVAEPTAVRRTVALSEAVQDGEIRVEEIVGRLADGLEAIEERASHPGLIWVLVDPELTRVSTLNPQVVVDARIRKRRGEGSRLPGSGLIGLGPGFTAPDDADAVVETNRGPDLGRVIWHGSAEADTGTPGLIGGRGAERVLRAPASGRLTAILGIGALVAEGDIIASVEGRDVRAPFDGLVRGLLRSGWAVQEGMKIGDVDPRMDVELCYRMSDKALAVAGGVLEASLMILRRQGIVLSAPASVPA